MTWYSAAGRLVKFAVVHGGSLGSCGRVSPEN